MSAHHGRIARLQSIIARDARLVRLVTSKQRDAAAVPLPGRRVFEHVLARLLREASSKADCRLHPAGAGLVSVRPYWHYFWAAAQPGWEGKAVLDVAAERFKPPRPREFYAYALRSGLLTLNGRLTDPDTVVRAGDQLQTVAHRHEPPVTGAGVRVVSQSEDLLVVEKPGGVPVHPVGRYRYNCLTHMMREQGLPAVRPVSRLDRLTSGVMLFPLGGRAAGRLGVALRDGKVKKEYLARVRGRFPGEPVLCKEKLLLVHRQLGLSIVHEEGKPSATAFARISYDAKTDTSLVLCRPYTGRTHQIRVHLLHLGHPIPNDPYYADPIWSSSPAALDGSAPPLELELPPLDNDASAEMESGDVQTASVHFPLASIGMLM
ncbi:pseudouridine synthase [Schizophyllum commune]